MFEFDDREIDEVRAIISKIILPYCFGTDDDDFEDSVLNDQLKDVTDREFCLHHGVTKAVIEFKDFPFVVKIPFDGWWDIDTFVPFEYASYKVSNNYCGADYDETLRFQQYGFSEFAPCMKMLGNWQERDIFVQEKILPYWEGINSIKISQNSREKAEGTDWETPFSTNWIAAAIEIFGEKKWAAFNEWAQGEEFIRDMHSGNYGFSIDGRPIIFDLSGYNDH